MYNSINPSKNSKLSEGFLISDKIIQIQIEFNSTLDIILAFFKEK